MSIEPSPSAAWIAISDPTPTTIVYRSDTGSASKKTTAATNPRGDLILIRSASYPPMGRRDTMPLDRGATMTEAVAGIVLGYRFVPVGDHLVYHLIILAS